jgi:para-aminobenzoate synthetase component I
MLQKSVIEKSEITTLKKRLIEYARKFDYACILDSHSDIFKDQLFPYTQFDLIAGFRNKGNYSFTLTKYEELSSIDSDLNHWLLGYLTYDLKNHIEELVSQNTDQLNWPEVFFFQPEILFLLKGRELTIISEQPMDSILDDIKKPKTESQGYSLQLKPRITKEEYLSHVSKIKEHIQLGDIYEINYCQEFYDTRIIDPYDFYRSLNDYSPSPFSAFYKYRNNYLLSASPERFLHKSGRRLISQPIKGTASRGKDSLEDLLYRRDLGTNIKERSENIMIVDLVRNDLSRIAIPNSVKVEELCGVHAFPQVYQMISTISAELNSCTFSEILHSTFPMGSMTGAPKIAAMKIAEQHECTKRGLYSGAVGYIAPGMDFDFNVVIRSLQYNSENKYLSYMVGSAITALSDAEKEYEECLLKAYGLNRKDRTTHYA